MQRVAAGVDAEAPVLAGVMLPHAAMSSGAVIARAAKIKRMMMSLLKACRDREGVGTVPFEEKHPGARAYRRISTIAVGAGLYWQKGMSGVDRRARGVPEWAVWEGPLANGAWPQN